MNNKSRTSKRDNLRFAVLAVDTVLLTYHEDKLLVRLMSVNVPPFFRNKPGLPGGLIAPNETAEQSSRKHVEKKTNLKAKQIYLEQVYTFTRVNRDPRNRVVAVAYLGLVPWEKLAPSEQQNTSESWWCPVGEIPELAFDHNEILSVALDRFNARLTYTPIVAHILPEEFTLTELEESYEIILNKKIDKRNFRKKIEKLKLLKKLKKQRTGLRARPASLYKFRSMEVCILNMPV